MSIASPPQYFPDLCALQNPQLPPKRIHAHSTPPLSTKLYDIARGQDWTKRTSIPQYMVLVLSMTPLLFSSRSEQILIFVRRSAMSAANYLKLPVKASQLTGTAIESVVGSSPDTDSVQSESRDRSLTPAPIPWRPTPTIPQFPEWYRNALFEVTSWKLAKRAEEQEPSETPTKREDSEGVHQGKDNDRPAKFRRLSASDDISS